MSRPADVWIEVLGRAGLRYHRGPRQMFVDSEVLDGVTHSMCVWRSSIARWKPPHDAEPVTEADRDQIIEDIRRLAGQKAAQKAA